MKQWSLLMVSLTLALALCGCGEDAKVTDITADGNAAAPTTTVSTTVSETESTSEPTTTVTEAPATDPTGSRTVVTKATTTTTAIPTTIRTLGTKPTTTKVPVTTTKAPTTTTTTAAEQPVDPSGVVQGVEYWGNDYRVDGTELTFTAVMFDGDYCVLIDRQFTSAPEVAEGTTLEYGGKTYYSVGGGMSPLQFTVSGNEIRINGSGTLALYRDGTIKVLESGYHLNSNVVFTLPPQG